MSLAAAATTLESAGSLGDRRLTWLRIAAIGIGAILVTAAVTKIIAPADALKLQALLNAPHGSVAAIVAIELVVGLMLIIGAIDFYLWLAATALFLVFAAIACYLLASGVASCGCFGEFKIPPAAMLVLDGSVVAFLIGWRRTIINYSRIGTNRVISLLPLAVGLLGLSAAAWVEHGSNSLAAIRANGGLVIVEPKTWMGNPFPLAASIVPSADMLKGSWRILMYHHDCPDCQKALPEFLRCAEQSSDRFLALEVPPVGGHPPAGPDNFVHATLSPVNEWFVQAPVEIHVEDGTVTRVSGDTKH